MKNKVVVFTDTGARILINPDEETLSGLNYLVNPDCSKVKGVDLHYWKREGDFVVPMTEDERSSVIIADNLPSIPIIEKTVEIVKEVPVEVIKEVFIDKIEYIEKPVIVEKIVEVPVEIIKEIEKEVIKEIEIVKEVVKIEQVPVEIIKYKTNEIVRLVAKPFIPNWAILTLGIETLIILTILTTYIRGALF